MVSRKNRSDSISELVKTMSSDTVSVPLGVVLRDEEEEVIWKQIVSSRNSWRDFDLLLISDMTVLVYDLRRMTATVREEGLILATDDGKKYENPVIKVANTYRSQLMSIIGKLSLGVAARHAIANNKSGKKSETDMMHMLKKESVSSLLAH